MSAGRCVVVTGGAHGIGAATCRAFVAAGDHVVIADLDDEAADALATELGPEARAVHLDAGDAQSWASLAEVVKDDPPSVIVNNAFVMKIAPAHEMPDEIWQQQLSVNLNSVYYSVRTFHAQLSAAQGSIVNVASVHAIAGAPGHAGYAASKGGVVALTRQLSAEYAPGIRVNAVLPGPILTRTWDDVPDDFREMIAAGTAMKRLGRAEEVASAIVFLASEAASYITGSELLVDGGQRTAMP